MKYAKVKFGFGSMTDFAEMPTLALSLGGEDWCLFQNEDRRFVSDRDEVARDINRRVAASVNENKRDPARALELGLEVLRDYRHWGASDTEPTEVLDLILLRYFGWETAVTHYDKGRYL